MKITPNWRRDKAPQVIAEPWRFGLSFGPESVEGDIARTCSCGSRPRLRGSFLHEGKAYASLGGSSCAYGHSADCYELHPFDPKITLNRQRFCYNDEVVTLRGAKLILCRPLTFISRPLTVEEWRWMLRQMFAHGGYFARIHDGKKNPYAAFLFEEQRDKERFAKDQPSLPEAIALEKRIWRKLPNNQTEMHAFCLTDPLYATLRPWDAAKIKPVKPGRLKISASADDLLADALGL